MRPNEPKWFFSRSKSTKTNFQKPFFSVTSTKTTFSGQNWPEPLFPVKTQFFWPKSTKTCFFLVKIDQTPFFGQNPVFFSWPKLAFWSKLIKPPFFFGSKPVFSGKINQNHLFRPKSTTTCFFGKTPVSRPKSTKTSFFGQHWPKLSKTLPLQLGPNTQSWLGSPSWSM